MEQKKNRETRLWRAVFGITDLLRELSAPVDPGKSVDVTVRQINIMKKVWALTEHDPGGITLKQLAGELKLTPGTVSELVDALVRKNALKRLQNPEDRREVRITLTEYSLMYVNKMLCQLESLSRRALDGMDETKQDALIDSLEIIQKQLVEMKVQNETQKNP